MERAGSKRLRAGKNAVPTIGMETILPKDQICCTGSVEDCTRSNYKQHAQFREFFQLVVPPARLHCCCVVSECSLNLAFVPTVLSWQEKYAGLDSDAVVLLFSRF